MNTPNIRSRGIGDTIHKGLHAVGVAQTVATVADALGIDCGCNGRIDVLNRAVPYQPIGDDIAEIREVCGGDGRQGFTGPIARNLMMYIYPLRQHEVWRWNVDQIRRRMPLFNGKRIVTIATDAATNTADEVQAAFGDERIDAWLIVRNDPARWEMLGLPKMLSYCHSCDQNEITFYCHGKGVQGPAHVTDPLLHEQPRIKWATVMYEACLDYMPLVEKALEKHTFAGAFKRKMNHGVRQFRSAWHFAGTFYWSRNAKLFSNPKWHVFDRTWYGAETYPGQLVGWYGAYGIFGDHSPIQYLVDSWRDVIDPAWESWKEANKEHHRPCTRQ